jgi:hypothetical protein
LEHSGWKSHLTAYHRTSFFTFYNSLKLKVSLIWILILGLYLKMLERSMSTSDTIWSTLGKSPSSAFIFKSYFLLVLTVLKAKCFIDLYPELKFVSQNVI